MVEETAEIVKVFSEADVLISPDALEFLKGLDDSLALAKKLVEEAGKRNVFLVEKVLVEELSRTKEEGKIPTPVEILRPADFKPLAKEWAPNLKFHAETDVTGKSKCKGKVADFVACFQDRLARTKKILQARAGNGLVSSRALSPLMNGREIRIAGLVNSKRPTKKGDLLLEIEDEEGIMKVWVGKGRNDEEKKCFIAANRLLLDEIVAFDAKWNDPFVIAKEVIWPDIPIKVTKTCENPISVAFLSDLHIGSKLFMEKEFRSFLNWLNGNAEGMNGKDLAGKIKYLVIAGDVADGIGIYPRQERELVVRDIFEQYQICAKFLEQVPDYIEIIVSPGNHDAVRRAEPQPAFDGAIADAFKGLSNVHLVGSPSIFEMEGIKTLAYHGTSLDSIIAGLPGMSYSAPEKPMLELLKRRHLSPLFGENSIVPEPKDYMVLEEVPDILHMGHVHKNGYDRYRGTLILNSGTWQARTEFQVKQGHVPSPCLLPIYNLNRSELSVVDFNQETPMANATEASK